MAQRRVRYTPKNPERFSPEAVRAQFLGDLLSGRVTANKLVEARDPRGNLVLDYDDPTGVGPRALAQKPDER